MGQSSTMSTAHRPPAPESDSGIKHSQSDDILRKDTAVSSRSPQVTKRNFRSTEVLYPGSIPEDTAVPNNEPVCKFTIQPPSSLFHSSCDSDSSHGNYDDFDDDDDFDEIDEEYFKDDNLFEDLIPEEKDFLKQSFESVKQAKQYLGWKGMQGIFEKMPEVAINFKTAPQGTIRQGDNWELMGQGITFLTGIERFLIRINKPSEFRRYTNRLMRSHAYYKVSASQMTTALDIFENVITDHLTLRETREEKEIIERAWHKFFEALRAKIFEVQNLPSEIDRNVKLLENLNLAE